MKFNDKIIAMMRETNRFWQQNQGKDKGAQENTVKASQNLVNELMGSLGVTSPMGRFSVNMSGFTSPSGQEAFHGAAEHVEGSQFISGTYANPIGMRGYKLYIPSTYTAGQSLPLVVMLHGCTQNPDDFAAGTGMNTIAEEQSCFVLYPAQTQTANSSKCWNWFKATDQQRGQGEPALIAGMTQDIISQYTIDKSKVYIAGLSAGGAMAVIMGITYPDVYAAVGIHSGLPYASAQDLPSALAAMKNGVSEGYAPSASASNANARLKAIPIIVFHGDQDTTVNPRNGSHIMGHVHKTASKAKSKVEKGTIPNGHAYTRTVHHDDYGKAIAEQWLIHGAGHAWSGGNAHGSYTDGRGPDASKEMMRFFSTHTS